MLAMKPFLWVGRFLCQATRVISAGLTVAALVLVVVAITAAVCVWEAASRFHIDPKALSDAMRDAVIVTIREGSPEQKRETIAALEQIKAADAAPFVPVLTDATRDKDPQVRQVAKKALDRIAPPANDEDEEE
jgi:hypothetical protein